jgi:hypothetical protein
MFYYSDLKLSDAISYVEKFCPVEIYYNGNLVWTDRCDTSEWIPMETAVKQFEEKIESRQKRIFILRIGIEIVDFHHSIIRLKGKRKVRWLKNV